MSSGDKLATWIFAIIFGFLLVKWTIEYHEKKLQLEELKLEKECVCRSEN